MQDQRNTAPTSYQFLTIKEVRGIVRMSTSTIWEWVKRGTFPQPCRLGEKMTRWRSDEVQQWMEDIAAKRA